VRGESARQSLHAHSHTHTLSHNSARKQLQLLLGKAAPSAQETNELPATPRPALYLDEAQSFRERTAGSHPGGGPIVSPVLNLTYLKGYPLST